MAIITEAGTMPWQEKPTPREGRIQRKPLANGVPGAPENFEFNMYRFHPGYATPRHRHNFEQMRFALSGAITYDPRKPILPGSLVYFPEGAYYGPQETPVVSDILLLQYGGASGQGYLSQEQLIAAREELSKQGQFHEGIYTWYDAGGTKHNRDAVEAIYERVFGRKVDYAAPRISESVCMNSDAHTWIPRAGTALEEKLLGTFTERKVSALLLRATDEASFDLGPAERQLLFSLAGDMQVEGRDCGLHTAVFCDRGEALQLKLRSGWQALMFTLPKW